MNNVIVVKRDQSEEIWNYDKLVISITKAGLAVNEAEVVADNVEKWAEENYDNGKILSTKIRDRVMFELSSIDTTASDSYKFYKKP